MNATNLIAFAKAHGFDAWIDDHGTAICVQIDCCFADGTFGYVIERVHGRQEMLWALGY